MRILLVTPRFSPDVGGIETVVGRLAVELTRAGHAVDVATQAHRTAAPVEQVQVDGAHFTVHRARRVRRVPEDVPAPGLYCLVRRLARRADVVHAHSYHTLAAPIAAAAARHRPLVLSLHYHGGGHSGARQVLHKIYGPVGRRLVAAADAVQVNSQAEAAFVAQDFARQLTSPPTVIGHGFDAPPHAEPFPVDQPVVLSVCRLEPYKQVATLVEASSRWAGPAQLVVVGDGSDRPRLEMLAAELSAPVRFAGRVSDAELARWWATASVFASASSDESFALTLSQSVAAGVPAVASAIPAHRELLEGVAAEFGVLVEGLDPGHWAASIDAALPAHAASSGHAPQVARSWSAAAVDYVDLYNVAISAGGRAAR